MSDWIILKRMVKVEIGWEEKNNLIIKRMKVASQSDEPKPAKTFLPVEIKFCSLWSSIILNLKKFIDFVSCLFIASSRSISHCSYIALFFIILVSRISLVYDIDSFSIRFMIIVSVDITTTLVSIFSMTGFSHITLESSFFQ